VAEPAVEARQVGRIFGNGDQPIVALRDVSISVERGEFVAVEGPSGCGKSTLLHLLSGVDLPDTGEVYLAGRCISVLSDQERSRVRRQSVGLVLPVLDLVETLCVWENVALATLLRGLPLDRGRARSLELLDRVGLQSRATARPGALSMGERQRVGLARALFAEPALLVADEPTSALDSVRSDEVLSFLRELADGGQTIVLATHDPRASAFADRSVRLFDGNLDTHHD
jgi:putative ABC transport system ATP-binding protein